MGYASHSVHSATAQPFGARGVLIELTLPTAFDYPFDDLPHQPDQPGNDLYERCVPLILMVLAKYDLPGCHAFPLPYLNEDGTVTRACGLYVPAERISARVVMDLRRELGLAVPGLTVTSGSSVVFGPLSEQVREFPRGETVRATPHAVYGDTEYATADRR
jgi:hypothetical protein